MKKQDANYDSSHKETMKKQTKAMDVYDKFYPKYLELGKKTETFEQFFAKIHSDVTLKHQVDFKSMQISKQIAAYSKEFLSISPPYSKLFSLFQGLKQDILLLKVNCIQYFKDIDNLKDGSKRKFELLESLMVKIERKQNSIFSSFKENFGKNITSA